MALRPGPPAAPPLLKSAKEDSSAATTAEEATEKGGGSTPIRPSISLKPATKNQNQKPNKIFRKFRSAFRSFPIIAPSCKFPTSISGGPTSDKFVHGGTRVSGTLFGYRKARVSLAFQENPNCVPFLLLELAIPTSKLLQDIRTGFMRIAFECEKNPAEKTKIADEPIWTMFCDGKKNGYGVKRQPSEEDLSVMQLLHAVSTGVGVLPDDMSDPEDGELSYMRADFERVIGSKDSETFYMMMPEVHNGPELSVFFVRL